MILNTPRTTTDVGRASRCIARCSRTGGKNPQLELLSQRRRSHIAKKSSHKLRGFASTMMRPRDRLEDSRRPLSEQGSGIYQELRNFAPARFYGESQYPRAFYW